ncbi:sensor histidine kinase [Actinoallomurus rhizosphaericola]|uniref:sensor histidine kinase n=1 Tax=Actinoallomurus rhizosphaericola TaxID=2952536 RepID=UPI00209029B1|nr:sensor domain-containing protein [Actinoallomurus rhizosphaericola]MCO5992587.1 sensor domain-containing protein [Actinoallomurus rhizosphaericola]
MSGTGDQGVRGRTTVWRAMARSPLRFVLSSWPWRALAYLVTGAPIGLFWLALILALLLLGLLLTPVVAGVALLAFVPILAVALAAIERRRLRWLDPRPAPSPHRAVTRQGFRPWLRFRLREAASWRELGYALLHGVLSVFDAAVVFNVAAFAGTPIAAPALVRGGERIQYGSLATIDTPGEAWAVVPIGFAVAVAGLYVVTLLAAARAALARALLVPSGEAELGERLVAVTASRARMAGAFETERRRIERDLHDGAQQRLTGLIMLLGLARLDGDSELIGKAQDEARAALAELRDLVRGIHPSILTDRGLEAAVRALAERSPVPVEVDVDLPVRPPEQIESAAYFVVAEALTNAAKHGGARRARVFARVLGRLLIVEIRDDGTGGADPGRGTGLQGLADRVAVHDGTLRLSSPPGGPTIIRVEMPCE